MLRSARLGTVCSVPSSCFELCVFELDVSVAFSMFCCPVSEIPHGGPHFAMVFFHLYVLLRSLS